MKNHWYLDRRFMVAAVSVVLILPWLFPKRIGILSYTRCAQERERERKREGGREGEREREGDVTKVKKGLFNSFVCSILIRSLLLNTKATDQI